MINVQCKELENSGKQDKLKHPEPIHTDEDDKHLGVHPHRPMSICIFQNFKALSNLTNEADRIISIFADEKGENSIQQV